MNHSRLSMVGFFGLILFSGACGGNDPVCGDSVVTSDIGEECDDGNIIDGDGCNALCIAEICSDGLVNNVDEACDDGNSAADDGCSATCTLETGWDCAGEPTVCSTICGDGLMVGPETCEDGNTTDGDGCSASCILEVCGDGVTNNVNEECDDGDTIDADGCSANCTLEAGWDCAGEPTVCDSICGDGLIVGPETCEDGNNYNNDICPDGVGGTCMDAVCGDGFVYFGGEGCDDANLDPADGCDAQCIVEPGFLCSGDPSICIPAEVVTASALAVSFGDTGFPASHCQDLLFTTVGTVGAPVELSFALDHSWVGDLTVTIISPAATSVIVVDGPGRPMTTWGDSSNLSALFPLTFRTDAIYDPELMGGTIATGENVCEIDLECEFFANPGDLSAFGSEAIDGTWQVCFDDSFDTGDVGVLDSVTLSVPIL